ncbi:MAG TPA: fatty acid desaturase, partial [Stellaceae bacterium]|nr:fatty acid desaturase [Stellaceae bacterium]
AALHGSSHYDLPLVLRWFTANIGIHHIHHLSSRIPYYRLSRVLREHAALREVGRLTLVGSLRCVPLALWDEERRRLVSFRHVGKAERCVRSAYVVGKYDGADSNKPDALPCNTAWPKLHHIPMLLIALSHRLMAHLP